ncbi:hypothetical protein TNCV_3846881 [Trichonephila clavipes]|nr:hypothetical protein TNCV_3846881 [Trichonephila clavipes]
MPSTGFEPRPNGTARENAITAMPAVEMLFPHTPTEGENKHRPALPAITWDWLLKNHPPPHTPPHTSAELDSCVDITSHDRRHPAANVLRTSIG